MMVLTAELSLYPNSKDYAEKVVAFCETLQNTPGLQVQVGVLSTLVTAEAHILWPAILAASTQLWETQQAVVHIKMAKGPLRIEDLPEHLK
ncbi:MAG: hypothetical protein FJZ75_00610 [Bacteroidetes bacterium]|nr:hypothetical protein [Bacteroidota bacterium]